MQPLLSTHLMFFFCKLDAMDQNDVDHQDKRKTSLANITRHLRLPSHDIFFPRFLAEKGDMTTKLER